MRRLAPLILLAAALYLLAGCGEEKELDVPEGEPVEIGELSYNVRLTRFLTPADREDEAYLVGQPDSPAGQAYLGVFLRIENEGDARARPSAKMYVKDTRDSTYQPRESTSLYALDLDKVIGPGDHVPVPGTTAASGDAGGLMMLFLVPDSASTNRPLELVIPGEGGVEGKVELDI